MRFCRMSFLVHLVVDEEPTVDSRKSVAIEDFAMVRDDFVPTAPLCQRQVVKAQDDAQVLPPSQRAGEDGAREALQQESRVKLDACGLGVQIPEVDVSVLKGMTGDLRAFARVTDHDLGRATRRQMKSAVQAHDLLDGGGAQLDAIFGQQQPLNAEPAGVAVLLLELERGVDTAESDLA